ncbi:restriction endonuclease, partial [Candidatus Dependentiae bacterium]|nr:restriction endonuclease [Candidatus Dependentiae bacterium]
NSKYVMRITGDNEEGKIELDNFIFPESRYPVIATTSKLMTTGVDAQTCKLIVLDQRIQSMTEFKQIIGRGTRINEDYNKFYFTIIDFKKATELFADPDFDGAPVMIYVPKQGESPVPPDETDLNNIDNQNNQNNNSENINPEDNNNQTETGIQENNFTNENPFESENKIRKYYVNNVEVSVVSERVQYFDANGRLITESLKDYTKKTLNKEYSTLNDFLTRWNNTEKKRAIIEELANQGVFFEALSEEIGKILDPFDIICHIVWDMPPLTRKERAENVKKKNYFTKYSEPARKVLDALLDKYADEGIEHIEETKILTITPFTGFGTPIEIIKNFGGLDNYNQAILDLEKALYSA